MKDWILGTLFAIFVVLAIYTFWNVGRTVNYSMKYESQVETTVREMVKPECLREPR